MDYENCIGYKGDYLPPFNYAKDLMHFQKITSGHHVIMGSNTYRSLENKGVFPLKNRTSIVLSREMFPTSEPALTITKDGTMFSNDLNHTFSILDDLGVGTAFVIGGAQIYELVCNEYPNAIQHAFITKTATIPIHEDRHKVYFPELEELGFKHVSSDLARDINRNTWREDTLEFQLWTRKEFTDPNAKVKTSVILEQIREL